MENNKKRGAGTSVVRAKAARHNDWRFSRRRVKQRAKQELIRYTNETSNNEILDQAVG
jgi:hypothetical protein